MVGRVMLYVVSMFLVDYSLVQLFVSSNFSVLTTYVYSCHTSLTVMPLSVFVWIYMLYCLLTVNTAYLLLHSCAI